MAKGEASYAQVERAIWTKSRFRSLSDDGRLLLLYIVTSPHATQSGLFRLPSGYACEDLKWTPERYKAAMDELIKIGLINYDDVNSIIFNPNQLLKFPPQNGNHVAGIIGKLKELPSTPLFNEFAAIAGKIDRPYMSTLIDYISQRLGNAAEQALNGYGKGFQTGFEPVSNGYGNPETEEEPGSETGNRGSRIKSSRVQEVIAKFDTFYSAYPKKRNKPDALKAWKKLAPENGLFETIMAAVAKQKRSDDWTRENGRFIPNPASWLNGRRWEDEVEISPLRRKSTW